VTYVLVESPGMRLRRPALAWSFAPAGASERPSGSARSGS
jgi:hypothetical protein